MVSGTTSTGFEFNVNEKVVNDWRFISAVSDAESNDDAIKIRGTVQMVRILLGSKETDLMEHVKQEDGTVPFDQIEKEVVEIFKKIGEQSKK